MYELLKECQAGKLVLQNRVVCKTDVKDLTLPSSEVPQKFKRLKQGGGGGCILYVISALTQICVMASKMNI